MVIGRSGRCAVKLSSATVSFEHAVVARGNGDEYFLENLSANGTFLNNERVNGKMRLKLRDQIRMGDTVARVEQLPAAAGAGSSRRWLLILVVLMLVGMVAVVIWDPMSGGNNVNWTPVYADLFNFAQGEARGGRLPAEFPGMLQEAWRLEQAGDRPAAVKDWLRLHVMLSDTDGQTGIQELSLKNPSALARLAGRAKSGLDDDEMRAALLQFVVRMERGK